MALTDLQKAALLAQIKDPQPPLGPSFGGAQRSRPEGLVGPPMQMDPLETAMDVYGFVGGRPQQAPYGALGAVQTGDNPLEGARRSSMADVPEELQFSLSQLLYGSHNLTSQEDQVLPIKLPPRIRAGEAQSDTLRQEARR